MTWTVRSASPERCGVMQNVSNDAAGTAADDAEGGAPLKNVKLSLTGFEDQVEREEIAETVQRLGGQFCSQLERHTCTHLLVADGLPKETEKVVAAKKWGSIALVPLAWLHACVQAGARVPEAGFLLSPLVPAAAPGQGGSQKEASARRSARAENTVLCVPCAPWRLRPARLLLTRAVCTASLLHSTGGVSAWEEGVARMSWQEAPTWDALHLSGFRIAFSGAPGDAATRCVSAYHLSDVPMNRSPPPSSDPARTRNAAPCIATSVRRPGGAAPRW